MVMGNEKVMLLTFELTIQGTTGTMNVYLPFGTLKPISAVLNPHVWISGRKEKVVDNSSRDMSHEKSLIMYSFPFKLLMGNAVSLELRVVALKWRHYSTGYKDRSTVVMQIANQKLFKVHIGKVGTNWLFKLIQNEITDHPFVRKVRNNMTENPIPTHRKQYRI